MRLVFRMPTWTIFRWVPGLKRVINPGGAYDVTRLVGFVGNLGYTYDERFLLDFSVRSDGSSLYGRRIVGVRSGR